MKFLPYVVKHLRHTWLRTASTIAGMALCVFLICTLQTILGAMDQNIRSAAPDRLATRHAVSIVFNMPYAYGARIRAVPGVRRVAPLVFFGGLMGSTTQDFANFFANFAVDPEPFFAMYPEYGMPPAQMQAFLADRRGAVLGRDLAEKFGWTIGSTFQLESFIPPYRTGRPFEFVVRAIFDADRARYPGTNEMQMFFHFDYLYESTRRRTGVGNFMVQVADPARAALVAKAIDASFENSDVQTRTESEAAFLQSFAELAGNLVLLLNGIGLAVAFTVLLVTANTMSMAVRERRTEIAVLKTLGFSSARVMSLIVAEAAILSATAGVLGVGLARVLVTHVDEIPFLGAALGQFPPLALPAGLSAAMVGVSLALGLAASLVPAWNAYRAAIVDALRAA
ncbi:MAG: FtsX-like permease family protein [Vicinamibacterales bacterium]